MTAAPIAFPSPSHPPLRTSGVPLFLSPAPHGKGAPRQSASRASYLPGSAVMSPRLRLRLPSVAGAARAAPAPPLQVLNGDKATSAAILSASGMKRKTSLLFAFLRRSAEPQLAPRRPSLFSHWPAQAGAVARAVCVTSPTSPAWIGRTGNWEVRRLTS